MNVKGWLLDTISCIDRIGRKEFTLDEMYAFESELSRKHLENHHIRDKIRQQLQVLRDRNYLEFTARGNYRLT
jgi:type II restriction enzyme